MRKISEIGSLLKRIYRIYSNDLLNELQSKGFIDLRPSFLEILMYICDNEAVSIKQIGLACGLKKQTMTSHLNELEKRGYIMRKTGDTDRRELRVSLTSYGEKFKFALIEVIDEVELSYNDTIGEVEMDRVMMTLTNFHAKMQQDDQQSMEF